MPSKIRSACFKILTIALVMLFANACSMLTGTKVWCEYMDEKSKADWSINEATEYAKHCVFDD